MGGILRGYYEQLPHLFSLFALKLTNQLLIEHMQYIEKHEILMTPQHVWIS